MSTLSEHDHEVQPGLPESLPGEERIVWQGLPNWKTLALRTFHVRKVAIYFAILLAYKMAMGVRNGLAVPELVASTSFLLFLAVLAVGLLTLFAWLMARTTLYTITTERIVMRVGVTIPMSVNLPFSELKDGNLKAYGNGDGDVTLSLVPGQRVSYAVLWPHCKMLHPFDTRPTLRAIPNAEHVAQRFARAIADASTDVQRGGVAPGASDFGPLATASD